MRENENAVGNLRYRLEKARSVSEDTAWALVEKIRRQGSGIGWHRYIQFDPPIRAGTNLRDQLTATFEPTTAP
jgi:hypothetical protein